LVWLKNTVKATGGFGVSISNGYTKCIVSAPFLLVQYSIQIYFEALKFGPVQKNYNPTSCSHISPDERGAFSITGSNCFAWTASAEPIVVGKAIVSRHMESGLSASWEHYFSVGFYKKAILGL
jgi:hypothetical protein